MALLEWQGFPSLPPTIICTKNRSWVGYLRAGSGFPPVICRFEGGSEVIFGLFPRRDAMGSTVTGNHGVIFDDFLQPSVMVVGSFR
jgi:hypothetical protein